MLSKCGATHTFVDAENPFILYRNHHAFTASMDHGCLAAANATTAHASERLKKKKKVAHVCHAFLDMMKCVFKH